jgi:hypothetical protein
VSYVRPAWIAGHRSEVSDEALGLVEAGMLYARGHVRNAEAQDALLKLANEARAELHYRASKKPLCDLI